MNEGEHARLKKLYLITLRLADAIRRRKAAILRISREVQSDAVR